MKNRKIYVRPRTDLIKVSSEDSILVVKKSVQGHADEPAKKNIWSSDEDAAEEQYGFRRVGGPAKNLWED